MMFKMPNEVLGRLRTLPQGLADLNETLAGIAHNDPARRLLRQMISGLELEIEMRCGRTPLVSIAPSPLRIVTAT